MKKLNIYYSIDDAIAGEKIKCIGEKITEVKISGLSGAHRKQGLAIQNGICWVEKSQRFSGTIKL